MSLRLAFGALINTTLAGERHDSSDLADTFLRHETTTTSFYSSTNAGTRFRSLESELLRPLGRGSQHSQRLYGFGPDSRLAGVLTWEVAIGWSPFNPGVA